MNQQLPLPISLPRWIGLDDFIPGYNRQLLADLHELLHAPEFKFFYLSGPPSSGKSHLLMGICDIAQQHGLQCAYLPLHELRAHDPGIVQGLAHFDVLSIDDLDAVTGHPDWETALLSLFEECQTQATRLIFGARAHPLAIPIQSTTFKSCLSRGACYFVQTLETEGLVQLIMQQAQKQGLQLSDGVPQYLIEHYSRDAAALIQFLEYLDRASLAHQRRITLPFLRDQLKQCANL